MTDLKIGGVKEQVSNETAYNKSKEKTEELINKLISIGNEDGANIEEIYLYIKDNFVHNRMLYSVISSMIYNLGIYEINELEYTCEQLVSYTYSVRNHRDVDETVKKVVLKLSDHINLALAQERFVQQLNDERLNESFAKVDSFIDKSDAIENKIENMNGQVISILGVFTAIAFVVFGGISSASSILSNINNTSLPKLGVLASIWGIAIVNLVYFLLYFMSKMTGTIIKTNLRWNAPVYRRHPYIFLINSVLVTILLISIWLCVIEKATGNSWILMIVSNNKDFLLFGTLLLIALIVIFFTVLLFKMSSDKHDW